MTNQDDIQWKRHHTPVPQRFMHEVDQQFKFHSEVPQIYHPEFIDLFNLPEGWKAVLYEGKTLFCSPQQKYQWTDPRSHLFPHVRHIHKNATGKLIVEICQGNHSPNKLKFSSNMKVMKDENLFYNERNIEFTLNQQRTNVVLYFKKMITLSRSNSYVNLELKNLPVNEFIEHDLNSKWR